MDHSFKDLIKELQRQQEDLKGNLEQKERAAVDLIEQIINDLKVKQEQLQDRQHDGDKLLHTTDAVLFLQVSLYKKSDSKIIHSGYVTFINLCV